MWLWNTLLTFVQPVFSSTDFNLVLQGMRLFWHLLFQRESSLKWVPVVHKADNVQEKWPLSLSSNRESNMLWRQYTIGNKAQGCALTHLGTAEKFLGIPGPAAMWILSQGQIQEGGKSDSFKTVWNISQNKDTDFLGTVAWIWELPATCKRWTNAQKVTM